jgi:hypothetical protein
VFAGRADARDARRAGPKIADALVIDGEQREVLTLARTLGVSAKRLLGWEPTERHEHFDADGNLTGVTVVTREAEWDDFERERLIGLAVYERGVCACGFHESVASDRENHFTFEDSTCPVCRGAARYARMQAATDERQRDDNAAPATPRPGDGRRTFIRRLSATEVVERRASRGAGSTR